MERSGMQGRKAYVTIGLALTFLLGVYFIYPIRVVVLVFLLTLLLATIMSAPVNYLARQGMPRVWGTLAVFVGLLLGLQLVVEVVIAPLLDQTQRLLADFPALLAEVRNLVDRLEQTTRLDLAEPLYAERLLEAAQDRVSGLSVETVASAGYSIANIVYLVVVILLTSVYAVLQPAPLVRGFVTLFPAGRRQPPCPCRGRATPTGTAPCRPGPRSTLSARPPASCGQGLRGCSALRRSWRDPSRGGRACHEWAA